MRNNLSKRDSIVKEKLSKSENNWDRAIADAKRGISRLQAAIRIYKENKAAGLPWPGNEKTGTANAIPAVTRNTETPSVV